jgi:hypothetical protein
LNEIRPKIIDELEKYGYEIEKSGKYYKAYRSQYIDDGYGFNFTSLIELTISSRRGSIISIKVDGYNLHKAEKMQEKAVDKCPLFKKYGECPNNEFSEVELTEDDYDMITNCEDCIYFDMIRLLLESLEWGNW